jgi:hypothetical protein
MSKLLGVLIALIMIVAACGGSGDSSSDGNAISGAGGSSSNDDSTPSNDDSTPSNDDGTPSSSDSGGSSGGDFCFLAADLEDADPFGDEFGFDAFNEEFFDRLDDTFDEIVDRSPPEIRADTETMRDGIADLGDILDEFGYDITDPGLITAFQTFDTSEFEAASDRVNDYAISECGIDLDGSDPSDDGAQPDDSGSITGPGAAQDLADTFSDLGDNPQALQALMGIFGVDEETAECLIEELGDFDFNNQDAAALTQEVCGTTLLALITGAGGG